MNEAETRAERIDPKLKACGWGVVEGSKVLREYHITEGKIQKGGGRGKKIIADYILVYKGIKLAVIEAKSDELEVGEGVSEGLEAVGVAAGPSLLGRRWREPRRSEGQRVATGRARVSGTKLVVAEEPV